MLFFMLNSYGIKGKANPLPMLNDIRLCKIDHAPAIINEF